MTAQHRPRASRWRSLVVLLATICGVLVTARLGFWQLDRAAQKIALERLLDERRAMPALKTQDVPLSEPAAKGLYHRPLILKGTWVPSATVYLDNRQMNGLPGFFVVTPLILSADEGSPPQAVLVQRGWVPRNSADRNALPAVSTPTGTVEVSGRLAPPPSRLFEFDAVASGPIRQNLSIENFAVETALPLLPFSMVQTDPDGPVANDGLLRQWALPALGVQKHHGYAFQWFSLAALLVGLYLWFQLGPGNTKRESA